MKQTLLTVLFCSIILSTSLWKGELMANDNIETYSLPNGLAVILVNDKNASLSSIRTYVKAGSIFEGAENGAGLSHYLEHLVAGGTTSFRSEDDYKKKIALLGGAFNAYTTTDHTSYFINTTNSHISDVINILYEWMFYSSFKESEVAREKEVITREIEKNIAHVGRQFYYLSQDNFYVNNPIKFPVIGYLDNFLSVSKEALTSYYTRHYVPSNMVLVVGGNFNSDEIKKEIKDTFGKEVRKAEPIHNFTEEPKPFTTRFLAEQAPIELTHVSFRFSTTHLYSPDLYPLDLLDYILGNGEESILYKSLVEDKKLAFHVNTSSYTPEYTTGYFDITAEINLKDYALFKKELLLVLDSIKNGELSIDYIERAQKQKVAEDILSVSNIEDKVSRYGQGYLYGRNVHFYEIYSDNFKQLTKEDLVKTAQKYFDSKFLVSTILYPETETLSSEEGPDDLVKDNQLEMITLKNGVKIIIDPDPNEDKTFSQIVLKSGVRYETEENNGIGHLLADSLGSESKQYDKDTLNRIFEDEGAHVGSSIGNNVLFYTLHCLSDDFEQLYPVFEESFLDARFTDETVEESKRKLLAWIKQRHDDWHKSSQYQFKKDFYNQHPYRFSTNGEVDSVESVTALDIETYFKETLDPSELIVSFYGNVDTKKIIKQVKKTFGKLKKQPKKELTLKRTEKTESTELTLPLKQDVTALYYGFDGVRFQDTEVLLKLDLLDAVLSGMQYPSGRLHTLLRDAGYVYMVYASNRPGLEKGHLQITALINSKNLEESQTIIESQIEDLKTTIISDEEFELAIEQMKFYYQDRLSTTGSKALIHATDELYNRGYIYSSTLIENINSLTKEDVKDMANQFLVNPQIYIFTKEERKEEK
jgi:zinc protease